MIEVYPCRVIITNNEPLANAYNNDPESALVASHCMTVEEAFSLFEEKKKIETVILVNGEGEELIHYLGTQFKWNKKNMPDIVPIEVLIDHESAIKIIRDALVRSAHLFLWAMIEEEVSSG